jgi:hypothetical protein
MALRKCRHCSIEAYTEQDLLKFKAGRRSKYGRDNCCNICANKRYGKSNNKVNKNDTSILQSLASRNIYRERLGTKPSWIYVVTNKHYSGWCKIGRTSKVNILDRLSQYNTYCPTESFVLQYSQWVEDDRIEGDIIDSLRISNVEQNREWFRCDLNTILYHISNYKHIILDYKKQVALKQCQPVLQFDLNGNLIAEYESMTQASSMTGVHLGSIGYVCKPGKRKLYQTGGFMWKLKSYYDGDKPDVIAQRQAWREEIRTLKP